MGMIYFILTKNTISSERWSQQSFNGGKSTTCQSFFLQQGKFSFLIAKFFIVVYKHLKNPGKCLKHNKQCRDLWLHLRKRLFNYPARSWQTRNSFFYCVPTAKTAPKIDFIWYIFIKKMLRKENLMGFFGKSRTH